MGSRTARLYATAAAGLAIEVDRPGGTVVLTVAGEPPFAAVAHLRLLTAR